MKDKDFTFKCSHCGLCQDDDEPAHEYTCKDDGTTELDLFDDDEPELIKTETGFIYRFTHMCSTSNGMTLIEIDVDTFYHVDTIYSALGTYCEQEDGLNDDLLGLASIKDGNGKWKDVFVYDGQVIGYWLSDCIRELDKAITGESYGKPLHDD